MKLSFFFDLNFYKEFKFEHDFIEVGKLNQSIDTSQLFILLKLASVHVPVHISAQKYTNHLDFNQIN